MAPVIQLLDEPFSSFFHKILESDLAIWLSKNQVMILIVWFVVFWSIIFVPLALGFGPAGVIGGSLAAGFQAWMYGAFTPAGGIFAVLTSIGMMGFLHPPLVLQAFLIASVVTTLVVIGWANWT